MSFNPERQLECFQAGLYEALLILLADAETSEAARDVVRELGNYLRDDAEWRTQLKRAAGWQGSPNAWAALQVQIEAECPSAGGPWWDILEFADGGNVAASVLDFFANNNRS